jgi:hypothetical protein
MSRRSYDSSLVFVLFFGVTYVNDMSFSGDANFASNEVHAIGAMAIPRNSLDLQLSEGKKSSLTCWAAGFAVSTINMLHVDSQRKYSNEIFQHNNEARIRASKILPRAHNVWRTTNTQQYTCCHSAVDIQSEEKIEASSTSCHVTFYSSDHVGTSQSWMHSSRWWIYKISK